MTIGPHLHDNFARRMNRREKSRGFARSTVGLGAVCHGAVAAALLGALVGLAAVTSLG